MQKNVSEYRFIIQERCDFSVTYLHVKKFYYYVWNDILLHGYFYK